jgi:hypothetical protein
VTELPSQRAQFIADLAEDVWKTYSRERQVSLDGIAEAVDIGITYDDFGNAFDGLIEHRSGRFHIFCNTLELLQGLQSTSPRVRFTLAHELGHYFIDEHRNALASGKPPHPSFPEHLSDNPAEQEANHFASHLLIPAGEFNVALTEVTRGLQGICDVSSSFGVSTQCAALRYVGNNGVACAIIMTRDSDSPWWDVSKKMEGLDLRRIRRDRRIPADSATGLALRDLKRGRNLIHQTNTLASEWFSGVFSGAPNDRFLQESALRLGSFGVLTLLEPC